MNHWVTQAAGGGRCAAARCWRIRRRGADDSSAWAGVGAAVLLVMAAPVLAQARAGDGVPERAAKHPVELLGTQTFTSAFEFFDALGDAEFVTENFEGFDLDEVIAPGTSSGGITYDAFPSAFGGLVGDDFFNLDFQSLYLERDGVAGQGATDYFFPGESVSVTFDDDVFAVGVFFNVATSFDFTDYMFIETSKGTASTGGPLPDDNGMFFAGIISDTPFDNAVLGSTLNAPTGWNMDDLTFVPAKGCAADINGDGVLNILDFVAFQGLFMRGDLGADCDGSGSLNVLDFVCFQQLFQAGCR